MITGTARSYVVAVAALLLASLFGCGAPPSPPSPPLEPNACQPGEWRADDGTCQQAGLPTTAPECPAGEAAKAGGGCDAAGTPPGACAPGFTAKDNGCWPDLPDSACPGGQIALPGEASCRHVAPCSAARFGEAPKEDTTIYVDASYAGANPDGSEAAPFPTVKAAITHAKSGAVIAIAKGVYAENVAIFGKAVRLWGACSDEVEIHGPLGNQAAVRILKDNAELHDLSVTSNNVGVATNGAKNVKLDRVWVHGTKGSGIRLDGTGDEVAVSGTLIESATGYGVVSSGASLSLSDSVLRGTAFLNSTAPGIGLYVEDDDGVCEVELHRSVIEKNHVASIYDRNCHVSLDAVVVRDTLRSDPPLGFAAFVLTDKNASNPAELTVLRSAFLTSDESAVFAVGSTITLESTLVSGVRVAPGEMGGEGIALAWETATKRPSIATIRTSLIEKVTGAAIVTNSSSVTLDATLVRDAVVGADNTGWGLALSPQYARPSATVINSVIERAIRTGIACVGGDLTLTGSVVRDTQPAPSGSDEAVGIMLLEAPKTCDPSNAQISWSRVEGSQLVGIQIMGSVASLESTVVTGTKASPTVDIGGGWGIYAGSGVNPKCTDKPSSLELLTSSISGNHTAGVYADRSPVTMKRTEVKDTEAVLTSEYGFEGVGILVSAVDSAPPSVLISESRFERNALAGIVGLQVDLHIEDTEVSDTQASLGIAAGIMFAGGSGTVRGSLVSGGTFGGITVMGADVVIEDTEVRDIIAQQSGSEAWGDGIMVSVQGWDGFIDNMKPTPASAQVRRVTVSGCSRAGLSTFGAPVTIEDSAFLCNGIDIDYETKEETNSSLANGGGNFCGCSGEKKECKAQSAHLAPPPVEKAPPAGPSGP